jgi:hypothetical protein
LCHCGSRQHKSAQDQKHADGRGEPKYGGFCQLIPVLIGCYQIHFWEENTAIPIVFNKAKQAWLSIKDNMLISQFTIQN